MKNVRLALFVVSFLMILGALYLFLWANLPSAGNTFTTELHLLAPDDWDDATSILFEQYAFTFKLDRPEKLKVGQTGHYYLVIENVPQLITVKDVEFRLRIRSELVFPGMINLQEGMLTQSARDDELLRFEWKVRAIEPGFVSGTLRLFIDYVSPDDSVASQLISVNEIQLSNISLSGLSVNGVTSLSVALVLMAGLAGGLGLTRPETP